MSTIATQVAAAAARSIARAAGAGQRSMSTTAKPPQIRDPPSPNSHKSWDMSMRLQHTECRGRWWRSITSCKTGRLPMSKVSRDQKGKILWAKSGHIRKPKGRLQTPRAPKTLASWSTCTIPHTIILVENISILFGGRYIDANFSKLSCLTWDEGQLTCVLVFSFACIDQIAFLHTRS